MNYLAKKIFSSCNRSKQMKVNTMKTVLIALDYTDRNCCRISQRYSLPPKRN